MGKAKKSGFAVFMNCVSGVCAVLTSVCFVLYYTGLLDYDIILWVGVTAFTTTYHFLGRIIVGYAIKLFKIDYNHGWFKQRKFEKPLYKFLKVRRWKEKVLTYDPESFMVEKHSLEEIAKTMSRSEVVHWINQLLSISSLLFALLWGELWIFALTAVLAMIFDAQFIVVQRYNRPMVLRLIERKKKREAI